MTPATLQDGAVYLLRGTRFLCHKDGNDVLSELDAADPVERSSCGAELYSSSAAKPGFPSNGIYLCWSLS